MAFESGKEESLSNISSEQLVKFQLTKPLNIHCYQYFQWDHGFQSKLDLQK